MPDALFGDSLAQHACRTVERYLSASPGDSGIDQLFGQDRAGVGGQDKGHLLEFRALRFVDGHGEGRFMGWQANGIQNPKAIVRHQGGLS